MGLKDLFVKAKRFLTEEDTRFFYLSSLDMYNRMPDEEYLKQAFKYRLGYELNLENPVNFNEKLQWLKLHDRNPAYTDMVDKIKAKEFVAQVIGEEHIIPTLRIWDRAEDVDFDSLPEQFVIKCNHNSGGGAFICKDRRDLDPTKVRNGLKKALKDNYFYHGREWPYLNVKPRILAEKYMTDGVNDDLIDYKVFTFGGKARYVQVDYNRFTDHHRNFYSREWEYVPFTTCYPTDPSHQVECPDCLTTLLRYAEELAHEAEDPKFLRVDFYIVKSMIYFGELTFYHGSGFERFTPYEYEEILGSFIELK